MFALEDNSVKKKILNMLKIADVGIEDVMRIELPRDTNASSNSQEKRIFLLLQRTKSLIQQLGKLHWKVSF